MTLLAKIHAEQTVSFAFTVEQSGFVTLDLTASCDSHWSETDRESAVVRLYVNEQYNQDCVLFYGNQPFTYQRLLGFYEPGDYQVRMEFREDMSAPLVKSFSVHDAVTNVVSINDPLALVYLHTPILYGRNLYHPFESRFTDTPLLLFYHLKQEEAETVIEYHMVFSHEDEGTPSPALMAKWGRTTDIEWIYRVRVDQMGEVIEALYQGPHHVTTVFQGKYDLGGHPVLQAATGNGNVSDEVTSSYRFLLPPIVRCDLDNEPREHVMNHYPFSYQVTAWEMERQGDIERPSDVHSMRLGDLRDYLYVQTSKFSLEDGQKAYLDLQVRLKDSDTWYSSSFHDFRMNQFRAIYDGPYTHFSTTIKLPHGTKLEDLEEICAVWLPEGAHDVKVETLRAFLLNDDYLPGNVLQSDCHEFVSADEPRKTLWVRA